jgi:undecaprenyl diphosphate synthase
MANAATIPVSLQPAALTVPKHLGLILDGNRRWAKERGLPVMEGHHKGYDNLKTITEYAFEQGVEYVSAYVFSTENWNRSSSEVKNLMKLLLWVLKHEVENLSKHGIRVRTLGSKIRLGKALVKAIHEAEEKTKDNTRGTLLLCLNYGGQQEIVDAMKQIVAEGTPAEEITAELISQHLYAPGVPPVDLIIRTSGEQRLSNFMLWEGAYSELMFTNTYWPDFSSEELQEMLVQYAARQRRMGK